MRTKTAIAAIIILLISALVSCGSATRDSFTLFSMDTFLDITLWNPKNAEESKTACETEANRLENLLSATIDTSDVSAINSAGLSPTAVSRETAVCVSTATKINELTSGAYDVTVAPLVNLWDIAHPSENWAPPADDEIVSAMALCGGKLAVTGSDGSYSVTKSDENTKIDLGGVGKGYACGALSELFASRGENGFLSYGGNVAVFGKKPDGSAFSVGVKDPFDPSSLTGKLSIRSGIVAVSGGYERYVDYNGKRYHHIIDPATGYPSESDLASAGIWVSVSSPEAGAAADALSTACFVLGAEKSMELYDSEEFKNYAKSLGCEFGFLFIKADGTLVMTDNISEIYTTFEK